MTKWYNPEGHLKGTKKSRVGEWHKNKSMEARRKAAINSKKGNYLSAARALGSLANVTKDAKTARLARADAKYFYKKHKETGR